MDFLSRSSLVDRCYRSFQELKTWVAAREHCRAQYADLFTWRDNHDEIFIKPIFYNWAVLGASTSFWNLYFSTIKRASKQHLAWAGATVVSKNRTSSSPRVTLRISFLAPTVKWVDPAGMALPETSNHWCDRTKHYGYESAARQPSTESRTCERRSVDATRFRRVP